MSELKRKSAELNGASNGAGDVDDDGFTKVAKRKQRKIERNRPKFAFNTSYFSTGKKIGCAHIRDLSVFIAADGAQKPSWIVVEHHAAVTHTVVVLATGLIPEHLGLPPIPQAATMPFPTTPPAPESPSPDAPRARLPTIPKLFAYGCPTRAPGDARRLHSVMNTLLMCPLPDGLKKKRAQEIQKLNDSFKKGVESTPLLYILTPNQLLDNGYKLPSYVEASERPFVPGEVPARDAGIVAKARENVEIGAQGPSSGTLAVAAPNGGARAVTVNEAGQRTRGNVRGEEGWVETPRAQGPPPGGEYPVLAIDCEMVLSEDGQELARVSVVSLETGEAVFDELVTPPKSVTDYVTQWSGMTAERMSKSTHTLESVQKALVTGPDPVITPHTILLGHSLDCDLAALKIRHPLVIDTTVIYRHSRGPPYKPSLKWLTQKWLGRKIQESDGGHDSKEDALACVDLLRMKLSHGPDFGDPSTDTESVFERLSRMSGDKKRRSLVADYGNPRAWFGAKATTAVACTSDDEVVDAVVNGIEEHEYVFCRLTELSNVQNWNTNGSNELNMSEPSDEDLSAALARFDDRLARLHGALPANTALIVLTGHADPRPMLQLAERQRKFESAYRAAGNDAAAIPDEERWLAEDDRALEAAVADAREGMSFFCVK